MQDFSKEDRLELEQRKQTLRKELTEVEAQLARPSLATALVSANARYAAGLEFKDGTRYPDQDKKERFNLRLIAGFLTRPLLGGATGPLIILSLNAKIFGDINLSSPAVMLLWSALGGLFAKTLLDKLKDVFANLIGAKN